MHGVCLRVRVPFGASPCKSRAAPHAACCLAAGRPTPRCTHAPRRAQGLNPPTAAVSCICPPPAPRVPLGAQSPTPHGGAGFGHNNYAYAGAPAGPGAGALGTLSTLLGGSSQQPSRAASVQQHHNFTPSAADITAGAFASVFMSIDGRQRSSMGHGRGGTEDAGALFMDTLDREVGR